MKHVLEHELGDYRLHKASLDGVDGEYYAMTLLIYDDETNECYKKESKIFIKNR